MSDLVVNPEDRFSRDMAHLVNNPRQTVPGQALKAIYQTTSCPYFCHLEPNLLASNIEKFKIYLFLF